MDGVPHNEDGVGGMHLYMPWWLDNKKLDFPRGYHIEIGGGRRMPGAGFVGGIHNFTGVEARHADRVGGYGKKLKDDYREFYGATVGFAGRGEMVPNKDCYCEIDPNVVDKWGIPVLRFHFKWSDYEIKQAKHMQETFRAIIHEMGGTPLSAMPTRSERLRARAGRAHHPRARGDAHGQRSEDVGAEQELPGARREERVRRRRRAVRLAGRQELHVDDPGAGDAHQRVHRRRAQEGDDLAMTEINRRAMLQLLGSAPVVAGLTWSDAEAAQAAKSTQAAKRTGAAYKPKFFNAHEWATINVLVDIIIPKDERSGSATTRGGRAGVHGFAAGQSAQPADGDARRPRGDPCISGNSG